MANEKLIPLSEVKKKLTAVRQYFSGYPSTEQDKLARSVVKLCMEEVGKIKPVDAVEVVPGQRLYNAHEVAEILADAFGDPCACNFNGNDEWLPEKCELLSACPHPVGVACWEQYLKHRGTKMDGERRTDNA